MPTCAASSASVGCTSDLPSVVTTTGTSASVTPAALSSRWPSGSSASSHRYGTRLRARKSRTANDGADQRCPTMRTSAGRRIRHRQPRLQQVVDHRVELLLRRVPRLEQVVVQVDDVDRVDRGVGVGVRGQQHPAGQREQVHRRFEELDAVHLRHPVVGQQQRDRFAAQLQLAQRVQRLRTGVGPHHPVPVAVLAADVAGHGPGDGRVVVDGEDRGVRHTSIKARPGVSPPLPEPVLRPGDRRDLTGAHCRTRAGAAAGLGTAGNVDRY